MNLMEITKGYRAEAERDKWIRRCIQLDYYRQAGSSYATGSRQKSLEKADGREGRVAGEKVQKSERVYSGISGKARHRR